MEFGIFNLMGSRDPAKPTVGSDSFKVSHYPTVEVFAEVAGQTGLADELG
jgi:hypothetical protein